MNIRQNTPQVLSAVYTISSKNSSLTSFWYTYSINYFNSLQYILTGSSSFSYSPTEFNSNISRFFKLITNAVQCIPPERQVSVLITAPNISIPCF